MRFTDTTDQLFDVFVDGKFSTDLWKKYIDTIFPGNINIFIKDSKNYDFEKDILPHLEFVFKNKQRALFVSKTLNELVSTTENRIKERFSKELDAEIVLYLGMCNGAGWVTKINGQAKILLGIEKILELDWDNKDSLIGLLYHELGHAFQERFGVLHRHTIKTSNRFMWQLFTEGVAMYFEQLMVDDFEYFHQDKNGWKEYFDNHINQLKVDFYKDHKHMKKDNQRYFGDWVLYNGYADAGYYLGARFLQYICRHENFVDVLSFDLKQIRKYYLMFMETK